MSKLAASKATECVVDLIFVSPSVDSVNPLLSASIHRFSKRLLS